MRGETEQSGGEESRAPWDLIIVVLNENEKFETLHSAQSDKNGGHSWSRIQCGVSRSAAEARNLMSAGF
jgi:hypothetical protein